MRVSLSGVLFVNKSRAGGLDSCDFEAPCGVGGGVDLHTFCFLVNLFGPPSPPIFFLLYCLLACSQPVD